MKQYNALLSLSRPVCMTLILLGIMIAASTFGAAYATEGEGYAALVYDDHPGGTKQCELGEALSSCKGDKAANPDAGALYNSGRIKPAQKSEIPVDAGYQGKQYLIHACRYVDNNSTNEAYFVPFKSAIEWGGFVDNIPVNTSLTRCSRPYRPEWADAVLPPYKQGKNGPVCKYKGGISFQINTPQIYSRYPDPGSKDGHGAVWVDTQKPIVGDFVCRSGDLVVTALNQWNGISSDQNYDRSWVQDLQYSPDVYFYALDVTRGTKSQPGQPFKVTAGDKIEMYWEVAPYKYGHTVTVEGVAPTGFVVGKDQPAVVTPSEDTTYSIRATDTTIGAASVASIVIDVTDPLPTVNFNPTAASGKEGDSITFTAVLSAAAKKVAAVDYKTASGTATEVADYTGAAGTLHFNVGDTQKTISVTTKTDKISEPDEDFTITLSNPSELVVGKDNTATGTITDATASTLGITAPASVTEGGKVSYTVALSPASVKTVTVDYAVDGANSTAVSGVDYNALSGSRLTFNAGDTSKKIDVQTIKRDGDQGTRTLTIKLSNATNASITDDSQTVDIKDDGTGGGNSDSKDYCEYDGYYDNQRRSLDPYAYTLPDPCIEGESIVLYGSQSSGRGVSCQTGRWVYAGWSCGYGGCGSGPIGYLVSGCTNSKAPKTDLTASAGTDKGTPASNAAPLTLSYSSPDAQSCEGWATFLPGAFYEDTQGCNGSHGPTDGWSYLFPTESRCASGNNLFDFSRFGNPGSMTYKFSASEKSPFTQGTFYLTCHDDQYHFRTKRIVVYVSP